MSSFLCMTSFQDKNLTRNFQAVLSHQAFCSQTHSVDFLVVKPDKERDVTDSTVLC